MKLLVFAALLSCASAAIELRAADFRKTIKLEKWALVSFTAPWCGHCKALHPQFDKVAAPGVAIYNVDASAEDAKELRNDFQISGFPMIMLFKQGNLTEKYNGARTTDALNLFVKDRTANAEVQNVSDVSAFLAQKTDTLFLLRSPTLNFEFKVIAEEGSIGCMFGWIEHPSSSLLIRQNLEEAQVNVDDLTGLRAIFERYRYPSVMLITDSYSKYAPAVLHTKAKKMIIFAKDTKPFWGLMRRLADEVERDIAVPVLAQIDTSDNLVKHFKLTNKMFPVALVEHADGRNTKIEKINMDIAIKFFRAEVGLPEPPHDEL